MNYFDDDRSVLTLDAGGTNMVFSAIQKNREIVNDITLPSHADDLDECIATMIEGFTRVMNELDDAPAAISFAFPGPADYPHGIIGDLGNLPAFRGGVALGPMLEEKFSLPVFINNDGDLYAYGEAIAGYLPYINSLLERSGNPKRYKNLLGVTLGTGFGAGIVRDGQVFLGDNSNAGDIWLFRDKLHPSVNVEEHASIRGVRRVYAREAGVPFEDALTPKEIYEIAAGTRPGDARAATRAFREMAEATGDALAHAISLIDGIVVIGGGLAGAADIFLPHVVNEMNGSFTAEDGKKFRRMTAAVYNLEEKNDLTKFLENSSKEIDVYGTGKKVSYDSEARIGIGISKIGTSKAISIGAYTFALSQLDRAAR
jgi:glucokinase